METLKRMQRNLSISDFNNQRRIFIKKGIVIGALAGLTGLVSACKEKGEDEVTPAEDLMREHGVLNRILLIYDFYIQILLDNMQSNKFEFNLAPLNDSVLIIRSFIEDYHEKLEEVFLFPRFENVNQLSDLVKVLRSQHEAGRRLTDQIMELTKMKAITGTEDSQKLFELLTDFNKMYRPHEAREDTVLFPAIRNIFSEKEYTSLGEQFEDQENKLFGNNGFENVVQKVADIEVVLGIYDLSAFNPLLI